ncbi:MAG: hypothetical protein K9G38_04075 [Bacteroidales bacterium]|nr:hypothetical protein [Bacteroidales bacterium]
MSCIEKRKYICLLILIVFLNACSKKSDVLYQSDEFTVYTDKVVQGEYVARALSSTHMVSNYRSTASENYSRRITFKFCINEKDIELPSGTDHWLIIDKEHASPVIQFGETPHPMPAEPGTMLSTNYEYTFRVDMSPVLSSFEQKGYYEAFNGSRIAASDFKAFQIAGGSEPLSWDFSNLDEKGLILKDPDGDGVYELTLTLNPLDEDLATEQKWIRSLNTATKPQYNSDQVLVDALFNLSQEEAMMNIESDSTLRTGAKWGGVWTRDVSYSTLLAFAFLEPEIAKISLMKKVKRGRIIQDTGSGGAWPVSSDRTTWSLAAWEIYLVTGDQEWLQQSYKIIRNSLEDDYFTIRAEETGMYRGESSFLDWREQSYPKWMSNKDIFVSENLGTNAVHYKAHMILAEMARLLGNPNEVYLKRAADIKAGINNYLWLEREGYYAQYLYGRSALYPSSRFEALGESLAVLFEVADDEQAQSIVSRSPVTTFGTTCIFPQIPGIPPYHNNGIWPFVQSFWNLAAAKTGNEEALLQGLAAVFRPAALFLTNYENFVAGNGDFVGTEINSDRMLWSIAGNLAMVYRLFTGISFEVDGIQLNPVIPKAYGGIRTLSNFKYRDAILNITVKGYGNEISTIKSDGVTMSSNILPTTISGVHNIEIVMKNNRFNDAEMNLVPNKYSLPVPQVKLVDSKITWYKVEGAATYEVIRNGETLKTTNALSCEVEQNHYYEYQVASVDSSGISSFNSEPIVIYPEGREMILECEVYVPISERNYTNYSGSGFVEVSLNKNRQICFPVSIKNTATYLLDIRYSNGTGPWNTDNNCAIRTLTVNGKYEGVLVFPQRGTDEWSDWGYSNAIILELDQGENEVMLNFEPWNNNMDVEINEAMLDHVRLIQID